MTTVASDRLTSPPRAAARAEAVRQPSRAARLAFSAAGVTLSAGAGAGAFALASSVLDDGPDDYRALVALAGAIAGLQYRLRRPETRQRFAQVGDDVVLAFLDALALSAALVLVAFLAEPAGQRFSRLFVVLGAALCFLATVSVRLVMRVVLRWLRSHGHNILAIAVVGSNPEARQFCERVEAGDWPGCAVVARFPSAEPTAELRDGLARCAREHRLGGLVVAAEHLGRSEIAQLLAPRELQRTELWAVPQILGLPPSPIRLGSTGTGSCVLSVLDAPATSYRPALKRLVDVVVAALALVLLSPVMIVAAVAVRLSSPGPIFFRQDRVGLNGRGFKVLKFRTMYHGASSAVHQAYVVAQLRAGNGNGAGVNGSANGSGANGSGANGSCPGSNGNGNGALYKMERDPRITPAGAVLRKLSIDELPQLFNVLKGEMSLVGPRPAISYETTEYEEWHWRRLDVRPGMTGLWQVSGRSKLSMTEMLRLDVEYVDSWSPWKDVMILLRTVPAVLRPHAV